MEKENNELNQLIKDRENKETLEISSTGYGLESVSNELNEKNHGGHNPSSCGGYNRQELSLQDFQFEV